MVYLQQLNLLELVVECDSIAIGWRLFPRKTDWRRTQTRWR